MTWESAHDVLEEKRKPQNRMCVCMCVCVCVWYDGKHCSKKEGGTKCIEKALEIFFEKQTT